MNHSLKQSSDYSRVMEAARLRASELRDEAVSDFWRDAGDAARRVASGAGRLAHSLKRHQHEPRTMEA